MIIWFTFPILKAFHEFGHAYAVKRWGGEVHEMGVMLLVLTFQSSSNLAARM